MIKSDYKIHLDNGITFSLPLSGIVSRFLAFIIDFFVILVLNKLVNSVINLLEVINYDIAYALLIILFFLISIGYNILLETIWSGQTIGKRLLHIRVIDKNRFQVSFQQIFMRNILRFVDMLPGFYLVGGVVLFFSNKNQRIGDIVANTLVIRTSKAAKPDWDQLFQDKYNSLTEYPLFINRLRNQVSPAEAEIALRAILRRDELRSDKRIELFKELTVHFDSLVDPPAEIHENITDEQYIRNLVQILYNR